MTGESGSKGWWCSHLHCWRGIAVHWCLVRFKQFVCKGVWFLFFLCFGSLRWWYPVLLVCLWWCSTGWWFHYKNNRAGFTVPTGAFVWSFCFNLSNTFMTDVPFQRTGCCCNSLWFCVLVLQSWQRLWYFVLVLFVVARCAGCYAAVWPHHCPFVSLHWLTCWRCGAMAWTLVLCSRCWAPHWCCYFKWENAGKFIRARCPNYSGLPQTLSTVDVTQTNFIADDAGAASPCVKSMLLYMLLYTSPFCLLAPSQKNETPLLGVVVALNALLLLPVLDMQDVALGTCSPTCRWAPKRFSAASGRTGTPYSPVFAKVAALRTGAGAGFLGVLQFICGSTGHKKRFQASAVAAGIYHYAGPLLFYFYLGLLCVTVSYFDRYLILPSAWRWCFTAILHPGGVKTCGRPCRCCFVFAYVSVAGTRDYFTVNRIKMEWGGTDKIRKTTRLQK